MSAGGKSRRPQPHGGSLVRDQRGVYYTEYTIVLVLVALALGTALLGLTGPLLRYHDSVLLALQNPFF